MSIKRRHFLRNATSGVAGALALGCTVNKDEGYAAGNDETRPAWNVKDFGAINDGKILATQAIQKTIDQCHDNGGGVVYFPPGTYLSGTLRLRSRVSLDLDNGAVLQATDKENDYLFSGHVEKGYSQRYYYLLIAEDEQHISITGDGMIRGTGEADLGRKGKKEKRPDFRIGILHFKKCHYIHIRHVNIWYSDFWTLHFRECSRIYIRGINITNNFYHVNSDGIDPVSCRDVFISDCSIIAGDDCICPKTKDGISCENIVVANCVLESVSAAIKLGTGSDGDFRNIHFSNCVIRNSGVGIGFFIKDGALAERITFTDISLETSDPKMITQGLLNSMIPLYMDIEKRYPDSKTGRIRDVVFRDIYVKTTVNSLIQGMENAPIENLVLENITIRVEESQSFETRRKRGGGVSNAQDDRITRYIRQPTYMAIAHVNGLQVRNVRFIVRPDEQDSYDRTAVSIYRSGNIRINEVGMNTDGPSARQPIVRVVNCNRVYVYNCEKPTSDGSFITISGRETKDISIGSNNFVETSDAVVFEDILDSEIPHRD